MAKPSLPYLDPDIRIDNWTTYPALHWGGLPFSPRMEDTQEHDIWFGSNPTNDSINVAGGNYRLENTIGNDTIISVTRLDNQIGGSSPATAPGGTGDEAADFTPSISTEAAPSATAVRDAMLKAWADFNLQWAAWTAMPRWDDNPAITIVGNTYTGTNGPERLGGDAGDQIVYGLDGNDYLEGGDGSDKLYGGEGNDLLDGGNQRDERYGGPGDDFYLLYPSDLYVFDILSENPDEGFDFIEQVADIYTLPANFEGSFLDPHPQAIARDTTGNDLGNFLRGNAFGNRLSGMEGGDYIEGLADDDTLAGGLGNDWLVGGEGNDNIDGGGDTDTADYSGVRSDYRVTQTAIGGWIVTDLNSIDGDEGTDTITDVEYLKFADGEFGQRSITPLDAIDWGTKVANPASIGYYIVPKGTSVAGYASIGWEPYEVVAIKVALDTFSAICNVAFHPVENPLEATFLLVSQAGLLTGEGAESWGRMFAPNDTNAGLLLCNTTAFTEADFLPGGPGFFVLIHELGHGLGLAHPHDSGGTSTVMPGVRGAFMSYGDSELNQGVFTMMSYNKGWTRDVNPVVPFVSQYASSPMALDIAVLQDKYGEANSNPLDTYILPNPLSANQLYQCIWEKGGIGTDTIASFGNASCVIDLRPATLEYTGGGGGFVSHMVGGVGGFTIAAGVDIENARGGAFDDKLQGNTLENYLEGGGGADQIYGDEGNDTIVLNQAIQKLGTFGIAIYHGGDGVDTIELRGFVPGSVSSFDLTGATVFDDTLSVVSIEQLHFASVFGETLNATLSLSQIHPVTGQALHKMIGGSGADILRIDVRDEIEAAMPILTLANWSANDMLELFTTAVAGATLRSREGLASIQRLSGNSGADTLVGSSGIDILIGNGGMDTLFGGAGNDRLVVSAAGSGSTVDGGADSDTLAVSGAVTLGTLAGLEGIELIGGATLTLSAAQFNSGFLNPISQIGAASVSGSGTLAFTIEASPGGAALYLNGLSFVGGSSVAVTIAGSSGIDVVKGAIAVANTITGGDGADQIRGGNQADTINGGIGNDKLFGWGGVDVLTGGTGSDQFRYFFATDSGTGAAADRITDFEIGIDKLNFTLIDTNPGLAGVQGFAFLGAADFTASGTGQIRYLTLGSDLVVQADVNGDGAADMEVILQNLAGQVLTASDFMLGTPPALEPLSGKGIGGGVDVLPGLAAAKGGGEVQAFESITIAQFQPEAYLHDPRFSVWGCVNEPWMI